MAKYAFELEKPKDENDSVKYRLVHLGRLWNAPKDVYLTKHSSGVYICTAEYEGESASSRFMIGDAASKLVEILKKQTLRDRKALLNASFPKGADQKVVDSWFMILNCISFSGKH